MDLSNCEITDDLAKTLAHGLQINRVVKLLDLSSNEIGNVGAIALGIYTYIQHIHSPNFERPSNPKQHYD